MFGSYLGIGRSAGGGGSSQAPKPSRASDKAPPTYRCQKCLKLGHYSYECSNQREYKPRPTRTQQLKNPKLAPKLVEAGPSTVTAAPAPKAGTAAALLAANEAKRLARLAKQAAPQSASDSNSDSESDSGSSRSSRSRSRSYSSRSRSRSLSRSRSRSPSRSPSPTGVKIRRRSRSRSRSRSDSRRRSESRGRSVSRSRSRSPSGSRSRSRSRGGRRSLSRSFSPEERGEDKRRRRDSNDGLAGDKGKARADSRE